MTNIRALPVAKNSVNNSFGGEVSRTDTFDVNNGKVGETRHKNNSVSPAEKDGQIKPDKSDSIGATNGGDEIKNKAAKRISLETAMIDARAKARNSVFASSGTNILEGMQIFRYKTSLDMIM